MSDGTTLLFGLPGVRVERVERCVISHNDRDRTATRREIPRSNHKTPTGHGLHVKSRVVALAFHL